MKKGSLSPLTLHQTIPAGCFLQMVPDNYCAPLLTAGQLAVIDPKAKLTDKGIFLMQIPTHYGHRRAVYQTSKSSYGWWYRRPRPPVDVRKVETYSTIQEAAAHVIVGGLSEGPMSEQSARQMVVGGVIGRLFATNVLMVPKQTDIMSILEEQQ